MKETIEVIIIKAADAIVGYSESKIAVEESSDCVVKALAACTGSSYDDAHSFAEGQLMRKRKQGVFTSQILSAFKSDAGVLGRNFQKIDAKTYYVNKGLTITRSMTFGTFIKQNPNGVFFLLVNRHAFAVVNGKVMGGNKNDATCLRKRLLYVFQRVN